MKNSKLNEICGYPIWINDINFDNLFEYLKEENFTLNYIEENRGEITLKYYLVSHDLLNNNPKVVFKSAYFPITKTPDYTARMFEVIKMCANYEIEKRKLNSEMQDDDCFII